MIRANKEKIKALYDELHDCILKKKRRSKYNNNIVEENRIFAVFCDEPHISPSKCAEKVSEKFGYNITCNDVINILKGRHFYNQNERRAVFELAEQLADLFGKAASGDKKAFAEFEYLRNSSTDSDNTPHKSQGRICAIMIYSKFPEIVTEGDEDILYTFGDTIGKYFFYDVSDTIRKIYGYPMRKKPKTDKRNTPCISVEQAMERIINLETELDRTVKMLEELQTEFDEQLEESKIKEMTDFFAKLNSERYGCILDQLLMLNKGVDELRKKGCELPLEINGLLIVIKKMIQFVKDSHIDPILKPNSVRTVTASDVEYYDYIGSPFSNETEEKSVRTLSPGWIFRDKEIQISRPRVKEEVIE